MWKIHIKRYKPIIRNPNSIWRADWTQVAITDWRDKRVEFDKSPHFPWGIEMWEPSRDNRNADKKILGK